MVRDGIVVCLPGKGNSGREFLICYLLGWEGFYEAYCQL